MPVLLASFWKPEDCGKTALPDRSLLIGQKLVENAKIEKFICDIMSDFQTLWRIFCTLDIFLTSCNDISLTYRKFLRFITFTSVLSFAGVWKVGNYLSTPFFLHANLHYTLHAVLLIFNGFELQKSLMILNFSSVVELDLTSIKAN